EFYLFIFKNHVEWSNELILEFLDLYEQEPCIWNPKHPHHKKQIKNSSSEDIYKPDWFAYEAMAKFLHSVNQPNTTRNSEIK
ncbi:MADF domain-containing protein, partial [Aphis craccivora]